MIQGRGYVAGKGAYEPEIMFVAAFPGTQELKTGEPYSGYGLSIISEVLVKNGLTLSQCYFTNVLKYQPAVEVKIGKFVDPESSELLWNEIEKIKPKKIIALGSYPLSVLCGFNKIADYRGSILRSQRYNILTIPTFDPRDLYRKGEISGYWQKFIIEFDIAKAIRIPLSWQPPYRNLWVAKNSSELYRFFDRNGTNKELACDIETFKCVPSCISFSFNKTEAVSVPLFQKLGDVQLTTIPQLDINEIWRLVDKALRRNKIIGQNFKFDQEKLEQELCFKVSNFYADIMLMGHVLNPELPKRIAFLASICTEEPFWKDEGKEFNPKKDKIDRLFLYNAKDSAVTKEIFDVQLKDLQDEGLEDYYFQYYHHLHDFYYHMELTGLGVDEDQRKKLISKYEERLASCNSALELVLGYVPNANSPKDMVLTVYEHLKLPRRDSLDEETLTSLCANHAKKPEQKIVLENLIEQRRLKKILGPDRLKFKVDWDGNARTTYRITGTETDRSSTAILEPPIRNEKIGIGFQTMSKHGDVGKDFRTMFKPTKPNHVYVNIDQSQAEARVVALFCEDYDLLELFGLVDMHKFSAAIGFDHSITRKIKSARQAIENYQEVNEALSSISSNERFIGKFLRHGPNYRMGKHVFMIDINTKCKKFNIPMVISEWKADQLLERIHTFSPSIRGVYHAKIDELMQTTRSLTSPWGARRTFFERDGNSLLKEATAHLPQHIVTHKTKRVALKVRKEMPDIDIVGESHDALLFQMPESEAVDRARIVRRWFMEPINFDQCSLGKGELIIPSDVEIGPNYGELKKVKLD